MFRPMRRKKQQLSQKECEGVLSAQVRGVLSVMGDDGYPYGLPIDYYYDACVSRLYFHCAKRGHKIDALNRCDKVSFCVMDSGNHPEGDWAFTFKSVVIFGRIEVVQDREEMLMALEKFTAQFPVPEHYFEDEVAKCEKGVQVLALAIEHMSGKRVHEA